MILNIFYEIYFITTFLNCEKIKVVFKIWAWYF